VEDQAARTGPLQDRQLRHGVEAEAALGGVGNSLRSRERCGGFLTTEIINSIGRIV